MEKPDPIWIQLWNEFWSIVYLCFISGMTGAVVYLHKIREDWSKFHWGMFVLSSVTGGLNGYFAFVLCDLGQLSWQMTAIITGAAGGSGWEMLKYIIGRASRDMRKRL